MYRNGLPSSQLKRVDPFQGLMIDADTWRDAHDYHRLHQQRHAVLLHGWGIVRGLEVHPNDPVDRSVRIAPGVAVDPDGRLMVVDQPIHYHLNTEEEGPIYLLLTFRDIPTEPFAVASDDGKRRPSRLREGYVVAEYDQLPDRSYIELARLQLSAEQRPVAAAPIPARPAADQIDLRFRVEAAVRPGPLARLGYWQPAPKDAADTDAAHASGLVSLARELSGPRWQLEWSEHLAGQSEPIECDLLVMPLAGPTTPTKEDVTRLTAFLDDGGVILAEPCVAHGSHAKMTEALTGLAQALGRDGKPVEAGHPLLTAAHVFSAPPPGTADGTVLEAAGLVLSQADYACAWNGGAKGRLLNREAIRTAHEWGANLLAYALARRLIRGLP